MKQSQNWTVGELYKLVSTKARGCRSKHNFYGYYKVNNYSVGTEELPINIVVMFLKTKKTYTGIRTYFLYKNKIYFTHFGIYLTFEKV